MNVDGTGATFREQSTWAQLITTVSIYGVVLVAILMDATNAPRTAWLLGGGVLVQVMALAVFHAVIAVRAPAEPDDERDWAIDLRSDRYSRFILGTGVVLAIGAIVVQGILAGGHDRGSILLHPLLTAQVLLLFLVGSEVVRLGTRAVAYRRG